MKLSALIAATVLSLAAGVASANHCPMDMKAIDAALAKNPSLSAADMDMVRKLRAEGETLHKAGKHAESVETLGKAMKLLGI